MLLPRINRRRSAIRALRACVEPLEARLALSVTIQLDYTYDNGGYFTTHSAAKAVLQQAATVIGSHLNDHLTAIPANGGGSNTWTAQPFDPRNVNATLSLPNLAVPADTIVVFAGAYNLGGGILGEGGPGGYSSSGSSAWNSLIATRGQAGAATTPQRDVGTWGGSITFNSATTFSYADINSTPGNNGPDFLSVALHELGHVLGLIPGEATYGYRDTGTNRFTGPHAEASYGGPVPLDPSGKHWADGVLSGGKPTVMDPTVPPAGQRATYTGLDWAALADTGWETDSLAITAAPPTNVFLGSTFAMSVAAKYGDGSTDTTYNGPITLSLASGPAGGTLQGTLTANAVNGVATFSGLSFNVAGSGYTIRASSDADTPTALSSSIGVSVAVVATKLVVTTQPPGSLVAGSTFSLSVAAEDANGNIDTTFHSSVTLAISTNPGSGTLGGTTTVTAAQGVATFTGLSLDKVASGYVLTTTATGLTLADSSVINVTQATAGLSLTPSSVTPTYGQSLTFSLNVSAINGLSPPGGTAQFRIDGADFGSPVTIASGLATSPAIATLDAGMHTITAVYSGDPTYGLQTSGTLSETISTAALTVTTAPVAKFYGSANPTFTVGYTAFVLNQDASVLAGTLGFATSATAASHVGTYAVTPSGLTSTNYAITFVTKNLTVTAAPLSITADPKSKLYGAANPAFSATYTGFVLNQGSANLTGTLAYATAATTSSHVGSYPITPSGPTSTDYVITFVDGSLTVMTTALSISSDPKTKTYGSPNPAFSATYTGFVLGQTSNNLTGTVTFATSATASSHVGGYAITPSGPTSTDYAISFVPANLVVTAAPLSIMADSQTKVYGTANPTFSAAYSGFVLNQGPADLTGTLIYTTSATTSSHVGTYAIMPSGQTSNDYAITFVTKNLTVTAAPLTITADAKTKFYGDVNPAFTATYSGFVLGQSAADLTGVLAYNTQATTTSHVGTYPITPSGQSSTDYAISFVPGNIGVTAAPLTITADPKSKLYGSANPGFSATYSGFVLGESASNLTGTLIYTTSATTSSHVGTYPVTPSGLTSNNYAFTFASGNLDVTPASLTVAVDPKTKVYGSANPAFTATYSGFVLGQSPANLTATLAFATAATTTSHVGKYPITPSGQSSTDYAISFVPGNIGVTSAPLAITANSLPKTYGADLASLSAAYTGFQNGDTPAVFLTPLVLATTATKGSHVGQFPIAASGATAVDYAIQFAGGTLTVTPAPLSIHADNLAKPYGAPLPVLTVSYSGFVNGDPVSSLTNSPTVSTSATSASHVGNVPISVSGAQSPDYAITSVDGVLSIQPVALTVTSSSTSKVYGQPNPTFAATYSGFVLGEGPAALSGTLGFVTAATTGSHVGSYPVTPTGLSAADYVLNFAAGTLAVTPALLLITPLNATRIYASANPGFAANYGGFVGTDGAASLAAGPVFQTSATTASHVGNYSVAASGAASPDYQIQYGTGILRVTPAVLTITANDRTIPFGSALPALTASYAGLVNNDSPASLATPATLTTTATVGSASVLSQKSVR